MRVAHRCGHAFVYDDDDQTLTAIELAKRPCPDCLICPLNPSKCKIARRVGNCTGCVHQGGPEGEEGDDDQPGVLPDLANPDD